MPSALVLDLAACRATNRFTLRDRMALDRWSEAAQARSGARLVVHERLEGDPPDVGNYAAVYAAGCCWASWGLSRRLGGIVVWDSVTGLDKACFASADEALSWVLDRQPDPSCSREHPNSARPAGHPGQTVRGPRFEAMAVLVEGVGFEPT